MEEVINQLLVRLEKLEKKRHFFAAVWVEAEAVDANLSIIDTLEANEITGTSQIRFVPKLASATPAAGDTVICLRDQIGRAHV